MRQMGTSAWVDNISREWFHNGMLEHLIESGIVGLTSNPSIFASAISATSLYDEQIFSLAKAHTPAREIAIDLATSDVAHAAQILLGVYSDTNHDDGWASLEVDPDLAMDRDTTFKAAIALNQAVDHPNVFIKIPATKPGLGAVEDAIAEGISVNVTLIFSIERYREVYLAYLRGSQRFLDNGGDPQHLRSVASFFVSRVDSAIDPILISQNRTDLMGQAAVAQARLAYVAFEEISNTPEAKALFARGIKPQRPLFASTSTKNPDYPKLLYVENLIGSETVNTMPLATVQEMLENGNPKPNSISENTDQARVLLHETFKELNIDLVAITDELERAGVESFSQSWHNLIAEINKKIA